MDVPREWTDAVERVCELVLAQDAEAVARRVPACPDWTVTDLLSHMIGLDVDVLAGDEPDDHNPGWTQRQVDARRGRPVADLVAEWRGIVPALQEYLRTVSPRPLGDAIIHEQDLRGALGLPGARDTDGLRAIRDRMAGRLADGLGDRAPVALVGDAWRWCSAGSVDDAALVLEAPDFDLARVVVSRRSEAQLRGWTTRGDLSAYLPAFEVLGPLPEHDLVE